MADQKIGVDFEIKTAAAKAAMSDLTGETRQSVTALDAAGKSTKTLGKDMAETKAQMKEASEVTKRVNGALKEAELATKRYGAGSKEATEAQKRLTAAQEDAKRIALAVAQGMERAAKEVTALAKAEDGNLSPATKRLAAQVTRMGADFDKTTSDVRRMDHQIALAAKTADTGGKSMGRFMASFAGNVAANAVGHLTDKFREGIGFVVETGAKYETLRMSLETVTGSSAKAGREFERLQAFASKTPFAVEELTESYIKLANRGIEPTERALTSFGNTASAMGKTLDQYVEAVADAITGENERLKEFGIVGKKAGDQIQYTFRGVTTSVKNDAESITNYLTAIGENNFAGGMEKQAQTMSGIWSTLKDNFAAFADQLMQGGVADALKEIMTGLIESTSGADGFARSLGKDLGDAIRSTVSTIKALVSMAQDVSEFFGGAGNALTALGLAAAALTGPFGAAAAAGAAIGYGMAEAYDWASRKILGDTAKIGVKMQALLNEAADIRHKEHVKEMKEMQDELDADQKYADQHTANMAKAEELAKRYEAAELARLGKRATEEDKIAAFRKSRQLASAVSGNSRMLGGGTEEDRLAELEKYVVSKEPSKKKDKEAKAAAAAAAKAARASAAADKRKSKFAEDQYDFNAEVNQDTFKRSKKAREEALKDQEEAGKLEEAQRERRIAGIQQEMDEIDARNTQQSESIDAIFFMVDVETEADKRREELTRDRLDREEELARAQVRHAQNEQQREEAMTKVAEAQSKKRINTLQRAASDERKTMQSRQALFEKIGGVAQKLTEISISAAEKAADGQKGALARGLADYTKDIAIKSGLKAAWEFALAAGSAASFNPVGAAAHGVAGGMALAVAASAGAASYGLGKVATAREALNSKEGDKDSSSSETGAGSGSRPSKSGSGRRGSDDGIHLERLDHPITYNEAKRGASSSNGGSTTQVTVNAPNLVNENDRKAFGQFLAKVLDENKSSGKRY